MSDSDLPLREQMTNAMDAIRRQIDLLNSPSSIGGGFDNRSVIADLEAEYAALKKARSDPDSRGGSKTPGDPQ
jgi:hypothetical protein